MLPKVSVIIPCYNCEKTIERTLDSLSAQTLKEIEVILVNDGSTDQTKEVIEAYQQSHPEFPLVTYHKENEGVAEARNYGLSKVNGEYVGFLDSDDYADEKMFETLYNKAKEDNAQVVVSNFYWENSNGTKIEKEGPYQGGKEMVIHLFATLWNKIYQTEFLRSLDIEFPYGKRYEDACYLYCMAPHVERISFVDEPFVHYVQQPQSITHTNNDQVKNMIDVFQTILFYYKKHGLEEEYHDELEYIHVKFFLGNSFLRSARIQDKNDRKHTIELGWNLLNKEFPNWHQNPYLKSLGGMKNRYFRLVNSTNLYFFAWIFRHFIKDNL